MFSSLLLSLGERLATFTLFSDQRGKKSPDGSDSPEPSKVQDAPQQRSRTTSGATAE
jgi:hypothetical protein